MTELRSVAHLSAVVVATLLGTALLIAPVVGLILILKWLF
jgi:hypothetical protein